MDKDKIGLALGGGAARGWAHIGVLRALDEAGIKVGIIAGTSVGAVVGGCYAAGKLDELEAFVRMLTARSVPLLIAASIEADPRDPQFIQTIRDIGYRFELREPATG